MSEWIPQQNLTIVYSLLGICAFLCGYFLTSLILAKESLGKKHFLLFLIFAAPIFPLIISSRGENLLSRQKVYAIFLGLGVLLRLFRQLMQIHKAK